MHKWAILGIVVLGFLLRVVAISHYPAGFTPDEASLGFDAYSLLKTGNDQWGRVAPLFLESFGDFKPPLYSYILIPIVWLLGLTKEAVRLPSVLFGTGAIYAIYLLTKELVNKRTALLASFLLSVSSWHIMMSRGAFEANLTTFLLPFAYYLFLKKKYALSAIVFGLNIFSYHSALYITLALVPIILLIYKVRDRKFIGVYLIFALLAIVSLNQGALARVKDVNIINSSLGSASEQRIKLASTGVPDFYARLIYNKYRVATHTFTKNYISYFSPKFLFIKGPAEATYGMLPGRGALYLIEAPFLVYGLWLIVNSLRKEVTGVAPVTIWLLLSPIPAALATGPGYAANRTAIILPALVILIALGVGKVSVKLQQVFVVTLLISAMFFVNDYFRNQPLVGGRSMLVGNLESADWLVKNIKDNKKIRVSRKLSEPHIYTAFAGKWDIKEYQEATADWNYKELGLKFLDQHPAWEIGNYSFADIDDLAFENFDILVGRPDEFDEYDVNGKIIKKFYYVDGEEAIWVARNY